VKTEHNSVLDTDNRWFDYCHVKGIQNPFKESLDIFHDRTSVKEENGHKIVYVREKTEEEKIQEQEWAKRRDEYLRLEHTFRLWDFHFWMDWNEFWRFAKYSKEFADISIYRPCDCADRQCTLACTNFGMECSKKTEELKTPQILGFEGRWEFHDTMEDYGLTFP